METLSDIVAGIADGMGTENIVGCSGESIVTDGREIEDDPCVSAWAAWWPESTVEIAYSKYERTNASFSNLPQSDDDTALLIFADPFSYPTDVLLAKMNEEPHLPAIGGMASGAMQPGMARVIIGRETVDEGAAIVALRAVPFATVVSQGCRPIGEPYVITKAERNVIEQLGGHPAHAQLKATYDRLPTRDKELMRMGIHLGRVVNEYQDTFDYGDFLIRNITGFDPQDSSISVNDYYRVGQTVQFHLRDAESASQDLRQILKKQTRGFSAKSALLFTCNGRGSRLFEIDSHDAQMVQEFAGEIPCAGFFCAGEIGPVGNQNFLHGFTASIALFG